MKKREKSAAQNLICSILYLSISSFFPFIIRSLLARKIGVEYLGVSSLFSSLLQIINIVDLNISSVLNHYFYKAGAEDNHNDINGCMYIIRKVHMITGACIILVGIAMLPFLKGMVINESYPRGMNVYLVFFVYVIQSASGYFYGYMFCVYVAYMKAYVIQLYMSIGLLGSYLFQIFSIVFLGDYYIYTISLLLCPLITAGILIVSIRKSYPWLDYRKKRKINSEFVVNIQKKSIAVFLSKLRNVSRNSLDGVIISRFLGLTTLALYQNYYQIILLPIMINNLVKSSITPVMGNSIVEESKESSLAVLRLYVFIQNGITTICVVCILSLIQPFVKIWMGADNVLSSDTVILLAFYYYVLSASETSVMLRDATGIWWQGKSISVIETLANLILNIFLVKPFGYQGVIFASILTVALINFPFEHYYVLHYFFGGGTRKYIWNQIKYAIVTLVISILSFGICSQIQIVNVGTMCFRILVTILIPMFMFGGIYFRKPEMKELMMLIKKMLMRIRNINQKNN